MMFALILMVLGAVDVCADDISLRDVPFWQHGSSWGLGEPKSSQAWCTWEVGQATGMPYGDGNVINFADLSDYNYLVITFSEGTPRVLLNRDVDEGQWNADESQSHLIEYPKDGWSSKYFVNTGNVLTVDLKQIVADKGYAHLHAIKGANYQDVLVESMVLSGVNAPTIRITVTDQQAQHITGFGAACCDGAMCPFADDTEPVKLLYGPQSEVGFNIMRMEISPNFVGDVIVPEWNNYDTPYDWKGSLPSAKIVKERGGIVFGTPWSPPGEFKTNGTAQGGNSEEQGYQRGELREDCYDKFFPWLNTFLDYMQQNGVNVDAVSVQNEPDWWVSYSGCLYTPQQQLNLVKNYAYMLDRTKYNGVRLISAEPLGFDPTYSNLLLNDETARNQIDIVAGHIYGHAPLDNGNLKDAAVLAAQYGKEVWMTEHSSDNIGKHDGLPTWHEQLLFAEELNECLQAGCTGYIYWYMRANWAFVGTGEQQHMPGNEKNKLLRRAYVMSHFSKYVTGSTRLQTQSGLPIATTTPIEYSAYIKGDSIIVQLIDTTATAYNLDLTLPYAVRSGSHLLSTENQDRELTMLDIDGPTTMVTVPVPARSLNTYVLMIDRGSAATITMTDALSTYCPVYDMDFSSVEGLKAYTATGYDHGKLTVTRVQNAAAGTGLLLKGTPGATYEVPYASTAGYYTNLLIGLTTDTWVSPTEGAFTNFLLAKKNGVQTFYRMTEAGIVNRGNAYLQLPTSLVGNGAAARQMHIVEDETTGVCEQTSRAHNEGRIYNLNGQVVKEPKAGVYIMDGRKVVIR